MSNKAFEVGNLDAFFFFHLKVVVPRCPFCRFMFRTNRNLVSLLAHEIEKNPLLDLAISIHGIVMDGVHTFGGCMCMIRESVVMGLSP